MINAKTESRDFSLPCVNATTVLHFGIYEAFLLADAFFNIQFLDGANFSFMSMHRCFNDTTFLHESIRHSVNDIGF